MSQRFSEERVYRTLQYILVASLGLVAVLCGMLIFQGVYGLILLMAGGVAILLAIALALNIRSRKA